MTALATSRYNNFNLLRILAAVQVMAIHAVNNFHLAFWPGIWSRIYDVIHAFPGVPMFFAISGFLIPQSWERAPRLKEYAWKRFLRIYPAMWVAVIVSAATIVCCHGVPISQVASQRFIAWLAAQLTVVQAWTPDLLHRFGMGWPNPSLWTIPIELEFYAAVPILWLLQRRVSRRAFDAVLVVLLLLSFAAILWIGGHLADPRTVINFTFIPQIWMFICGWLIYRNWDRLRPALESRGPFWFLGYLGVVVAVHRLGLTWANEALLALLAPVAISLAFTAPGLTKRVLGEVDLSYGIYLYHFILINVLIQVGCKDVRVQLWVTFLGTFALAAVSWFGLERRALKLKMRALYLSEVDRQGLPDSASPHYPSAG